MQLYAAGGRNFLFMNVPPVDRSPGTLARDAATQARMAGYIGNMDFASLRTIGSDICRR